jgi:hypothetical protein
MRSFSTITVLTAVSLSVQLAAQVALPAPVARFGPEVLPDPYVNTTIINNDGIGGTITALQQCEVRSIGGGLYRVAATATLAATPTESTLVTGTLVLTGAVPVWIPNQDVAAFNMVGNTVDEYQLSISEDGLTAVWDRYVATSYPNSGAAANSFCCRRASTAVPFDINDIRAIAGVGAGGVDPHIGEELANGHVTLFHIDFVTTNNAIVKGDLDPVTGVLGPVSTAASYAPAAAGFNHSPFVHRDSTGAARALNYSEYPVTPAGVSSAWFTEGVNDDGSPEMIVDGAPSVNWINNPGLIGGTWHYCSSGATEPRLQEVTMIANTTRDANGIMRVPAWAPVRPQAGTGAFLSVVGLGENVGISGNLPYALPPVINDLHVFLTVGYLDLRIHDPYTGLAEWAFLTPHFNLTFEMQLVTLDTASLTIMASNTAQMNF